jgi:hypothetical protein
MFTRITRSRSRTQHNGTTHTSQTNTSVVVPPVRPPPPNTTPAACGTGPDGTARNNGLIPGVTCCASCGSDVLVVNNEHRMVCRSCAHVNDHYFECHYARRSTYERATHLNERLAQYLLDDPPMADELFELVENEAFEPTYPTYNSLTKEDIRKICRSIKVPRGLQEQFRSKKFKMKPLVNMTKYVEKWLHIKNRLCGYTPNYPSGWVIEQLRTKFAQLQVPFEIIRHKPECPGGMHKCHLLYKCRHNFINYNFTIIELLKLIIKDDKVVEEEFLPMFPQLKSPSKRRQLRAMWDKLIDYIGWGKVYTVVTHRQRLVDRLGQQYANRSDTVAAKRGRRL